MGTYIGVKQIKAFEMTRAEYNKYRGWKLSADNGTMQLGWLASQADMLADDWTVLGRSDGA